MIGEGELVPKFELEDADGNLVKSSELKGKKHVVYFYPRDFTPGCTTEADEFSKDYSKFKKAGIEIVGNLVCGERKNLWEENSWELTEVRS